MAFVNFLRSTAGRMLRVIAGLALIAYGSTHASLVGLVLMMIGVVPVVTGLAGIYLGEGSGGARPRQAGAQRPREHRA
jgi:hypothetical protein